MTVGTAFHPRTAALNEHLQWRAWSGFFAASAYHDSHVIEYNAIREAAALIDVSPLFKYELRGPDAVRLVDRLIVRDATKLAPGRVFYTPWCDEHGKVLDDGTIHRLEDEDGAQVIRWTAADPQIRWLRMNAHGLDVDVRDVSDSVAAVALQGPLSRAVLEAATGAPVRRPGLLPAPRGDAGRHPDRRLANGLYGRPRLRAVDPGGARRGGMGRARGGRRALSAAASRHARARRRPPGGGPDPDRGRLHERGPLPHPEPELLAVRDRAGQAGGPGLGRLHRPPRARRRDGGRRTGAASRRAGHRVARDRGAPRGPGPGPVRAAHREPDAGPDLRRAAARSGGSPAPAGARSSRRCWGWARSRSPTRERARAWTWNGPSRPGAARSPPASWTSRSSTRRASAPDRDIRRSRTPGHRTKEEPAWRSATTP